MKKILGIAVLLAIVAVCLTFTACPDTTERYVTFINQTTATIRITGNFAPVKLEPAKKWTNNLGYDDFEQTVTKVGEDITIEGITADSYNDEQLNQYVYIWGTVIAGEKQPKDGKSVALKSGTLYFTARIPGTVGGYNPVFPSLKIDTLDE